LLSRVTMMSLGPIRIGSSMELLLNPELLLSTILSIPQSV